MPFARIIVLLLVPFAVLTEINENNGKSCKRELFSIHTRDGVQIYIILYATHVWCGILCDSSWPEPPYNISTHAYCSFSHVFKSITFEYRTISVEPKQLITTIITDIKWFFLLPLPIFYAHWLVFVIDLREFQEKLDHKWTENEIHDFPPKWKVGFFRPRQTHGETKQKTFCTFANGIDILKHSLHEWLWVALSRMATTSCTLAHQIQSMWLLVCTNDNLLGCALCGEWNGEKEIKRERKKVCCADEYPRANKSVLI